MDCSPSHIPGVHVSVERSEHVILGLIDVLASANTFRGPKPSRERPFGLGRKSAPPALPERESVGQDS